jgi:hypothetical protein
MPARPAEPPPEPWPTDSQFREAIVCHVYRTCNGTSVPTLRKWLGITGSEAYELLAEAAGWQAAADQRQPPCDCIGCRNARGLGATVVSHDRASGHESEAASKAPKDIVQVRSSDRGQGHDWRYRIEDARAKELLSFVRKAARRGVTLPHPSLVASVDGGQGED